jgi:hypothetical protein
LSANLDFSKWVNIVYAEQMTAGMIDRLIHHSYLLLFDGPSCRIEFAGKKLPVKFPGRLLQKKSAKTGKKYLLERG